MARNQHLALGSRANYEPYFPPDGHYTLDILIHCVITPLTAR
jgi:hypothetical protein